MSTLWVWGSSASGQLGQGNTTNRSSPVQVGTATGWTSTTAGEGRFHGVETGRLFSWGSNGNGRLGDGSTNNRSSPVQIGTASNWSLTGIKQGTDHSLAFRNGALFTWGSNGAGRLGTGNTTSRSSPVQVGSLTTWSMVAGAGDSTVALKTDGTLWAWGGNGFGQLGQGNTTSRSSPVQVGSLNTWSKVVTGNGVLAIKTDGTLWVWGRNQGGQLGLGDTNNRSSPIQLGSLNTWQTVSAGAQISFATKTDGTLWAWGLNTTGQLGDGTVTSKSSPVQVGSLTTWSQVAAGYSTTALAIRTDGTLWAWGEGSTGELGQGTSAVDRSSPVQVGSLTTWGEAAAAGSVHSGALKNNPSASRVFIIS